MRNEKISGNYPGGLGAGRVRGNRQAVPPPDFRLPPGLPSLHGGGELLELAYKEATERGANGVASLSMSTEETFVTIDDIRKPSGGGKYSDAVYPSASGSPVTIPVRKIKISGTLIRIQR